jgi:hypothetical protein
MGAYGRAGVAGHHDGGESAPLSRRPRTARSSNTCSAFAGSISVATPTSLPCADSEHDARERSTAELDAPSASPALGCCKHESGSRAAGVAPPLSDKPGHAGPVPASRRERAARRMQGAEDELGILPRAYAKSRTPVPNLAGQGLRYARVEA